MVQALRTETYGDLNILKSMREEVLGADDLLSPSKQQPFDRLRLVISCIGEALDHKQERLVIQDRSNTSVICLKVRCEIMAIDY